MKRPNEPMKVNEKPPCIKKIKENNKPKKTGTSKTDPKYNNNFFLFV